MTKHRPSQPGLIRPANRPRSGFHGIHGTLLQLLQQAGAFCKAGQWSKAEQVCRSLLKAQPDNFEALNLLGIIASQTQRNREAAELICRPFP